MRHLCCSLLTSSLSLLLLLDAGSNSLVERRVLQVHRRYEWTRELLLGDEGVQLGLLGRPSLKRVDRKKTPDKVNECNPVVQFCRDKLENQSSVLIHEEPYLAQSHFASCSFSAWGSFE